MEKLFKTKHINWVRLRNLNNEQFIQAVLDWSEDDYCDFKFESGISYAKTMTDDDVIGFDVLTKTRFFWQWWKNEWAKRDADFLHYFSGTIDRAMLNEQYLFQHSIHRLKSDELMERKACSMIGYCFDEYHQKKEVQK